jgi:hypothetical protein
MSTNIPLARTLLQAALQPGVPGPQMRALIHQALSHMTRKRTKKATAPVEGRKITPELEEEIWRTYIHDPDLSVLSIAIEHDVNPGRVSEVISRRSV